MNRPYIICHMTTSVDGKVTGDFLSCPEAAAATELYYEINRNYKAHAYACGRVTMEGSFTGGWYPDLSAYPEEKYEDFVAEKLSGFYAVAFDPHGRLGWKSERIIDADEDPGYDKAQIIEVLSRQAEPKYIGYLKKTGISYIFAGEQEIDIPLALEKLRRLFGIETLLLEGGSILNGAFQRAGVIDELSLVVAPVIGGAEGKALCFDSMVESYRLEKAENHDGVLWLNYKSSNRALLCR